MNFKLKSEYERFMEFEKKRIENEYKLEMRLLRSEKALKNKELHVKELK